MARYCADCGHEIPEGMRFCPECGREAGPSPAAPAAPSAAPVPAAPGADKVVSTGAFWGLQALYSIPLVGFISSVVFCAASENKNIKHHALATLIAKLTGVVLLIVMLLLARSAIQRVGQGLEDFLARHASQYGASADPQDMQDIMDMLESGDLEGFLEQYGDEDLRDLLEQYGIG